MSRMPVPAASEAMRGAEAALALIVAGTLRRTMPARRWQRVMGTAHPVAEAPLPPAAAGGHDAGIGSAVTRAAGRLPWHSTCLDQAVAGQLMLRVRRRPGVVVIGLRPGEAWGAHAWLVSPSGTVTGIDGGAGYTPVSAFSPAAPGRT